jgi:hypothetical protein
LQGIDGAVINTTKYMHLRAYRTRRVNAYIAVGSDIALSPDGKKLAFLRVDSSQDETELVLFNWIS